MTSCPASSDSALPVVSTIGRFAGVAVSLILALAAVSQIWHYGGRVPGLDFYQFWVVGTELRCGGAVDIYSDSQRADLGKSWLDKAKDVSSRHYRAASKRPVLETFSTLPVSGGNFSKTLLVVFSAAVAGSLVLARRRANEEESSRGLDEDMPAISLGVAMMLISSSLAWLHYFVLLVPTAIYCFRRRRVREANRVCWREQTVAAVAVVLIALHPLKLVMTFHSMYLPAAFCSLGTVMLSILVVREIVSVRNHADSPHSVGNQRDDETLVPA